MERHTGRLTSGSAVVEEVPERGYTDATSELPFGFALGQLQDAQHQNTLASISSLHHRWLSWAQLMVDGP